MRRAAPGGSVLFVGLEESRAILRIWARGWARPLLDARSVGTQRIENGYEDVREHLANILSADVHLPMAYWASIKRSS